MVLAAYSTLPEYIDEDAIAEIASRLVLRMPNRESFECVALAVAHHYERDGQPPPFEGVVVSATGVGKTYVLAAAMEYFRTVRGVRNFAVVTPGRTILEKTRANFEAGHPKSLLGGMSFAPVTVTSENFATPMMRAEMEDDSKTKLFLFTVQALTRPENTETGRRTHKYQEGLGGAFYEHLQSQKDLVVFADEHHVYYGPAFSKAVRDLKPWVLLGLTATPHRRTPPEQIIYRYPLAHAIADQLVKTPVIVGRRDDRNDALTKLTDGVHLLEAKVKAVNTYCAATGTEPVNPVMLVIAPSINDATNYETDIRSTEFFGGRYRDAVLVVTSASPDDALAKLAKVEERDSPVRIVICVGMLKEGWDVKNVYVIASMRALISEILTEQTLGRGLRLPFGHYTGIELLDTLEVLAHERYDELLRRKGVLNEAFVDYRTRPVFRLNAEGRLVGTVEVGTTALAGSPLVPGDGELLQWTITSPSGAHASITMRSVEGRQQGAQAEAELVTALQPLPGFPPLQVPVLEMSAIESTFSLADIADKQAFFNLGHTLAQRPEDELRRTRIGAQVVTGFDGLKRTQLVTSAAVDRITSQGALFPLVELRGLLLERILLASVVVARPKERTAAEPLVDAFLAGLGDKATAVLSNWFDRAAARFITLLEEKQREFAAKPTYGEVVKLVPLGKQRAGRAITSADRMGAFSRSVGYVGWRKSLYAQAWFDSSTERSVANILDDPDDMACWVRLHTGDLPILWSDRGSEYNPDFIAVETSGTHYVVEAKMDDAMRSAVVAGKREAAQRWANHVSADAGVGVRWEYLLVSETDVETAKGSWGALKALGGT